MGFLWFKTKAEKEQERLLEEERLNSLAKKIIEGVATAITAVIPREEQKEREKPYLKARMSNNTITVVTKEGDVLTSTGDQEMFKKIQESTNIEELKALFIPQESQSEYNKEKALENQKKAEFQEIKKLSSVLDEHPEFEQVDGAYMLKGVKLSLPKVMIKAFGEVLNYPDRFSALKNFWYWLSTNPVPEAIEDTYRFVERNDVKITPNGLLVLYRGIVSVGDNTIDKERAKAISDLYAKIKMAKKGPANYTVWKVNNTYVALKQETIPSEGKNIGNLKELYINLPSEQGNLFTDNHTKSMKIQLGSVYKIDEDHVDRNNKIDCSRGLHVGSKNFGIGSFGDTKVMCLVNPSKIRAVPLYDSNKMRVSEMFIATTLENEKGKYRDEEFDLVGFDDEYFNISVKELEEMAKSADIQELAKHKLVPTIGIKETKDIVKKLSQAKKAIQDRVKLLD
jgi:hypothetical protein